MKELKSVKITERAQKGLQLLKAMEGTNQTEYASKIINEALESQFPDVWKALNKWTKNNEGREE